MIDLQLALGIVEIADAEDVLEEELLRAFPEVFELGGGDGGEPGRSAGGLAGWYAGGSPAILVRSRRRGRRRTSRRAAGAPRRQIAVEDRAGAAPGGQLKLTADG